MALPTQEDFLANALEPVEHEDCSICHAPMETPVRLPCKHELCKDCITEWLTQPRVDSCPMCRRRLFQPVVISAEDLAQAREAQRALDAASNAELVALRLEVARLEERRRIHTAEMAAMAEAWAARRVATAEAEHASAVLDAFKAAGLERGLERDAQTDFRSADVLNLNDSIRWTEGLIVRLRLFAREFLIDNELPRLPQGAVRIHDERLGTSLIFLSNALMHLAIEQGRPWSVAIQGSWREMVINIWQLVSPENGLLLDRQSLYFAIMSCAIEQQCTDGDEQDHTPPMFFRQPDFVRDVRFMVNFVVDQAGSRMESDVVREELAAHRIEEPRVFRSTVSARAERLAATYTSMTFVHV
jgi:hypothetical protein